jgi:hypothetical protein
MVPRGSKQLILVLGKGCASKGRMCGMARKADIGKFRSSLDYNLCRFIPLLHRMEVTPPFQHLPTFRQSVRQQEILAQIQVK